MTTKGTPEPEDVLRAITPTPITQGEPKTAPDTERPFSTFMKGGGAPNPLLEAGKGPQVSPFDLAHGRVPASGPTFHSVQEQAKVAHATLGDISNQLKTPKLKLKQSTKYLLKNKLSSARAHIASASAKLGAKTVEDEEMPAGAGPLQKFLGLVTGGQRQLKETQRQLTELSTKGKDMRPADFLQIQIKLSKAQQELEYSSVLLGKAMDDLKMLMSVQL